jgi:sulfonate transport system substrate-binding protein
MTLAIGVHPNNLHLRLARSWPGAFADVEVRFVDYAEGRETHRFLAAGEIDIGGTGSTPPILAQAAGLDVQYVAASLPRPANGAILVAPGSPIATVAALAGKRVALLDGSFHTYLLARKLEQAGLRLRDVERVELQPAAAKAALAAGKIEAWIAMAPHLDQALEQGTAALLAAGGDSIPNRSLFWSLRRRGLSAALRTLFTREVDRIGQAAAAASEDAARLLAGERADAQQLAAWRTAVARRDWRVVAADDLILAEQQAEADTLLRHGELARAIELAAAA